MGIVMSVVRAHVLLVILIMLACVGLSAFALVSTVTPEIEAFVDYGIRRYDDIFPEIIINKGKASITKPQPYLVDGIDEKYLTVIIDTRDGKQGEALNYLKDTEAGVILTQDAVVIKNSGQIRIVPLKGFPDIVLNSAILRDVADKYLPLVRPAFMTLAIIYFLIVKPIQVLVLALIPFVWASHCKVPITYGRCIKISVFAMILPVLLDLLPEFSSIRIPSPFFVYFGLYVLLMILAARDLVKNSPASAVVPSAVKP